MLRAVWPAGPSALGGPARETFVPTASASADDAVEMTAAEVRNVGTSSP